MRDCGAFLSLGIRSTRSTPHKRAVAWRTSEPSALGARSPTGRAPCKRAPSRHSSAFHQARPPRFSLRTSAVWRAATGQWERSQIPNLPCDWLPAWRRRRRVGLRACALGLSSPGCTGNSRRGEAGATPRTAGSCRKEAPRVVTGAGAGATLEPHFSWRRRKRRRKGPVLRPSRSGWMCPARCPGGRRRRRRPPCSCARRGSRARAGSCPPRCSAPTASSPASGRPSPS